MATDVADRGRKELGKGEPVSQARQAGRRPFAARRLVHYQAQLRSLEQFQQNFAAAGQDPAAHATARTPRRLVVFVDDLDRCLPEKAIQVLEALKLFLDVEGCIFVLALDDEAIESAVRRRYQGEVKAREYLEKIIQLPFILPPIEAEPMRELRRSRWRRPCPTRAAPRSLPSGLTPNPRQVKRTLNIFLLLSRLVAAPAGAAGDASRRCGWPRSWPSSTPIPTCYDLLRS